jgi:hypothetical protein
MEENAEDRHRRLVRNVGNFQPEYIAPTPQQTVNL